MLTETEFGPEEMPEPRQGFTPTTAQLKAAHIMHMRMSRGQAEDESAAEFERWLEQLIWRLMC